MGWSCRRPGCGREAEVCISYDALACQVWLDPIAMAPAGGQPLCADHAQRLSAPRGWVVLDRRTSQSTLMTAAGPAPVHDARGRAAVPRRRLPRAWGQFDAPRLEFLAEGDDVVTEPEPTFEPPVVAATVHLEPALIEPEPVVEPEAEPEPAAVVIHAEGDVSRRDLHGFPNADSSEPEAEAVGPEPEPVVEPERAPTAVVAPEAEPVGVVIHAEGDVSRRDLHGFPTADSSEPEPELVVEPEAEPIAVVEPEPVAEPEPEPEPVVKKAPARRSRARAETGPLGKPKGRLLSRAFEASGPQRSAITESLEALGDDDGSTIEAAEG
ncbi:MAG TPA: DUF3499 family protein [Microthrixaceae bacterium]|nr:DUF3499 family protein [Microthrixaceae bacterium]